MLTRLASTYFLATPVGKKKQSTLVTMTGEIGDDSKVDPLNAINVTYEDLFEEQRQKFKANLKWQNKEIRAKMLACYGKTRQGVIEKEKFVMPGTQSATPPAPQIDLHK